MSQVIDFVSKFINVHVTYSQVIDLDMRTPS